MTRPTLLLLAFGLVSCKDAPTAPPVVTSLEASSSTSITAVVGTAVSETPAVIVKDRGGAVMVGVPVRFSVVSGGGSVAGAAQTTNSSGIASVGGWTLGTTAGTNTLAATAASLPAVTFTATGVAGAVASLTKSAGDNQTVTAGAAVATAPAVTVKDAYGNLVSGVSVTFAVTSGAGSVTGGPQTSDVSGVATVGAWILGTGAGSNTLIATVGSLAPITFTATAVAGAAASLTKSGGDNQTATVGAAVATAPAVTVKDAYGNVKSGVTVTFVVVSGGGSVTGGTATSNSAGVAAVGSWTVGGTMETNTLTASATGVTSVTFTATIRELAIDLTFQHLDGYRWDFASVYPASNPDWHRTVTFHWESTSYAAGGHGTIYGVHFGFDEYEPGVYAAQVAPISETNLESVQQAACAGLAYSEYYSRIADGQILCLKRVSTGEFAAVKLLSHVNGPGGTYAQSALLRVKTFGNSSTASSAVPVKGGVLLGRRPVRPLGHRLGGGYTPPAGPWSLVPVKVAGQR